MSASWPFNRSADHLARWFFAGAADARQSSRAEHANSRALDNMAPGRAMENASNTLGVGDDAEQRTDTGCVPVQRPTINPHSA